MSVSLPFKVLVGTHHKTGSVWLHSIFFNICRNLSLNYYSGAQDGLPDTFDIFFHDHSYINTGTLEKPFRGLHMIRDPRDVIISGCFYHRKADEAWLHEPREEFQNRTYQQKINSLDSDDDRILFEMENTGADTIRDIVNWDYQQKNFCEIKYEDLIEDVDLLLFHKIFTFLGFPGTAIPGLLSIAHGGSLFSGHHSGSQHVRSGKKQQWKQYFRQVHKDRFHEMFGDTLVRLGYETDENW